MLPWPRSGGYLASAAGSLHGWSLSQGQSFADAAVAAGFGSVSVDVHRAGRTDCVAVIARS
jgi:hypothetical protein